VAQELLDTHKTKWLVLDWHKRQESRASVQFQIETILDKRTEINDRPLYNQKCHVVYQQIYDSYYGSGRSLYTLNQ